MNDTRQVPQVRRHLPALLILLGVAARIALYAHNRSLWVDEASLALNIVNRSFADLFKPLDYAQGAPVGFLLLAKLSTKILGNTEYALRLVPLLASLLSLPLFYSIAKRFLSPCIAFTALALYCFSPTLIYYASEVKQYSSDAAITLLLLWLLFRAWGRVPTFRNLLPLTLAGVLALWLSHPALFTLAACYVALLIAPTAGGATALQPRRPNLPLTLLAAAWSASFFTAYFISLRALSKDPLLRTYWSADFPPIPFSVSRIAWYFRTLLALFQNPAGIGLAGLSAAAALLGLRHLYTKHRWTFYALALPLAITLAASALHAYPFRGRLLLFASPILILLLAAGLDAIHLAFRPFATIAATLLLAYTLRGGATAITSTRPDPEYPDLPHREDIRPLVQHVARNLQPGDAIFAYSAQPYLYYAQRFNIAHIDWDTLHPATYDFQGANWSARQDALADLKNHKRAWILLSHVFSPEGDDQLPAQSALINTLGTQLESTTSPGAALYLYDTTH